MAKVVSKGEKTVLMEISKTELYVYIQAQVNMVSEMEIESEEEQAQALLILSAVEVLLPHALPETVRTFEALKQEIIDIEWDENNEEEEIEIKDESNVNMTAGIGFKL